MAYGYSRGGRGYEPDPRDVIEDAAHAAGMSVQEWLERASLRDDGDAQRMSRRRYRGGREDRDAGALENISRRYGRRAGREDGLSEDRVAKILDDAMGTMQDTIRASEEKTASVIAALEQQLGARNGRTPIAGHQNNAVQRLVSDIQHGILNQSGRQNAHEIRSSQIDKLEERISNVISLIEKKAQAPLNNGVEGNAPVSGSHDSKTKFEREIALLEQRMESVSREMEESISPPGQDMTELLGRLNREVVRLGEVPQPSASGPDIMAALEAIKHSIGQNGQISSGPHAQDRLVRDRLAEEIADLRASFQSSRVQPKSDLAGLERRFETLDSRLDQLSNKIASLRPTGARDLRGHRSFDTAVAELKSLIERNQQSGADQRLFSAVQALEQRLDALTQSHAQRDPAPSLTGLEQKFDFLRARLDDISEKIADRRIAEPHESGALIQIGHAVEDLKRTLHGGVRPQDDARVVEAFHAIERRMEAMERTPAELVARVDQLHSFLAAKTFSMQSAGAPDMELMLQKLAGQIDRLQGGGADDRAFDKLHQDIRAISERLNSVSTGGEGRAFAELGQLERSVSTLLGHIDGLKSDIGSTAEMAVRRAAQDVLQQVPRVSSEPSFEGSTVQRQLSDMHVAQQEADKRTSETLGAVHNALTQVVNRLVDMEQEMKKRQELPVPATVAASRAFPSDIGLPPIPPLPVMPVASAPPAQTPLHLQDALAEAAALAVRPNRVNPLPPLGLQDAPVMEPRGIPQSVVDALPVHAPREEAIASTIAGMRAQRLGVSAPTAVESRPGPANSVGGALATAKGMLAGLKLGKDKPAHGADVAVSQPSFQDSLKSQVATSAAPQSNPLLDLPLEPGSGRPRQGAIYAAQPAQDLHDPKANFLSAARRAAQVAADQSADAMGQATVQAKGAGGKAGLNKRHALLLGLAALIVAVGATLTFMKDAPPPQAKKEAPAPTSSILPTNREAAAVRRLDGPQQTGATSRQIVPLSPDSLPPVVQQKQEDRVMSQSTRTGELSASSMPPDLGSVGSIASDATRTAAPLVAAPGMLPQRMPGAANDQLLKFEGINGSDRLKDAARSGDPSAFIELANRYLEGKGAPRDAKIAALWLERAADFGSAPAQYHLGALYREGKGVERNTTMALKHFQAAAEAGNARAMHNTAVLLAEGANGGPDYPGATEWFKKAADFGIRDSQYNLAILYARGLGTSQDLLASYTWFAAAAASGDEDAGKKRDEVGARMSPERLQQAKAAALSWKAKTPDPSANEVTKPAGGWDSSAKQVPSAAKPPATQRRI